MYDLSGVKLASNADFETAWKARGSDLAVIDCPGDVGDRYAYERQYGVDSIVYEVIHTWHTPRPEHFSLKNKDHDQTIWKCILES